MNFSPQYKNLYWLNLSVFIILIDQLTKHLANNYLVYHSPVKLLPFFALTLSYNTGAAFSFLSDAGGWQQWLFAGLAIGLSLFILMLLLQKQRNLISPCGFALIIGGAIGNLIDRLYYGFVIDFLDLFFQQWHWPIFNIADSAIVIGAFLLILDLLSKNNE